MANEFHIIDNKKMAFTASFVEYVYTKNVLRPKARFNQMRQNDGFLMSDDMLLDEETTHQLQLLTPHLSLGLIISFKANIRLENLEFKSLIPHLTKEEYER